MRIVKNNKKGFTLAEVLITLTIIGIVAALAIPTLIKSIQNDAIVTKLQKAQSTLIQAYNSFTSDGTTMDAIFADGQSTTVINKVCTKLSCTKNCGTGPGCFPFNVNYRVLSGAGWTVFDQNNTIGKAILADGSLFGIRNENGTCNVNWGTGPLVNSCGNIYYDINGFKGPNQVGRDMFVFILTRTGVFPFGAYANVGPVPDCKLDNNGFYCTYQFLTSGTVSY